MVDDYAYLDAGKIKSLYSCFWDFFLRFYGHHYNPLDTLLNVFLFKIFPSAVYFYAFNLFLFYINCIFLFFNIKNWTGNRFVAATSTLFFAVHPFNAENLSHITFNTVFFCTLFLQWSMLGFWNYISDVKPRKIFFYLSLICLLAGLLFLETALLFPIYICLLCLLKPLRERFKILVLSLPFWALSIAYFILWIFMTRDGHHLGEKIGHLKISIVSYTATLGYLLKWYLGNLFFPNDPVFIKSSPVLTEHLLLWFLGVSAIAAIMILLIYIWRRTPKSFALLWFLTGFIFMFPASLIHAYQMGMVLEPNWFFFSSCGFFMLAALLLEDLKRHVSRTLVYGLMAAIILFWSITSYRHHIIAKTEFNYLKYWLSISRGNGLPSLQIAYLYRQSGSPKITPDLVPDMERQANLFIKTKDYVQAAQLIDKIILSAPQNQNRKILETTRKALALKISNVSDRQNLLKSLQSDALPLNECLLIAIELNRLDLYTEALGLIEHGLKLYPNDTSLRYIKAVILANQNNFSQAKAILDTNPQDPRFLQLLNEINALEKKF